MTLAPLFTDIADAIRFKKGTSAQIAASDFPQEILSIPTGSPTPPPITRKMPIITWLYRDTVTGEYKVTRTNVPKGGTASPPSDVGDVQENKGTDGLYWNPALTFEGWNHSSTAMQNIQTDMCIGADYVPADGWNYFYLRINPKDGLTHMVFLSASGTLPGDPPVEITIDWMDGTPNYVGAGDTDNGISKTWSSYGIKTIRAKATSATGSLLVGGKTDTTGYLLNQMLFSLFLATRVHLRQRSLVYITDISIARNSQNLAAALQTFGGTVTFYRILVIPLGATILDEGGNYTIQHLSLPSTLTQIRYTSFQSCYSLDTITFPATLATLAAGVFMYPYGFKNLIFLRATPPSITSTTFQYMRNYTRIYVPDANVNAYKTATNWTAYATQIFPLSELIA